MIPTLRDYFTNIRSTDSNPSHVDHPHFVVAGCSHSAGVGVERYQRYDQLIQQQLGLPAYNVSLAGGCAAIVSVYLSQWIDSVGTPDFVVAQWPQHSRWPVWVPVPDYPGESYMRVDNPSDRTPMYKQILRSSEDNFWSDWLRSVVLTNVLCRKLNIPIVNIYFDILPKTIKQILEEDKQIKVYDNQEPDYWPQDRQAADRAHHSARCHRAWTNRILGIINETTTR